MSFDSWKGKVLREWSEDGNKGGTILQIAQYEKWGGGGPLWTNGHWPDSCAGMQPFLQQYVRRFASLIDDEPRQELLRILPDALSTHDFGKHGVNNIAEAKRCLRGMNTALRTVKAKRPSAVINSIKEAGLVDDVRDRVVTLHGLAQHHDKERVYWALYETWWGGMHNVLCCAENAAIVMAALDVQEGIELFARCATPHG